MDFFSPFPADGACDALTQPHTPHILRRIHTFPYRPDESHRSFMNPIRTRQRVTCPFQLINQREKKKSIPIAINSNREFNYFICKTCYVHLITANHILSCSRISSDSFRFVSGRSRTREPQQNRPNEPNRITSKRPYNESKQQQQQNHTGGQTRAPQQKHEIIRIQANPLTAMPMVSMAMFVAQMAVNSVYAFLGKCD